MNKPFTIRPASSSMSVRAVAFACSLACAGLASAQETVTIYGIVDAGVTRVSGLAQGSVTQVASGMMEGSRWGLRGNEDLGGGYRTIFTLENRFESDTGSLSNRPISGSQLPARFTNGTTLGIPALNAFLPTAAAALGSTAGVNLANNLFDRQAYLGLVTPVGAVLAGRQYTPAYELVSTFDVMSIQSALSAAQVASFPAAVDIRVSNSVAYRIVTGGVSAALMYGAGETGNSNSNSRLWGANVIYKGDGFSVGAGYNTRNNESGQKSLTTSAVGASADLGGGTASALMASIKDDNPSGLSTFGQTLNTVSGGVISLVNGNLIRDAYIAALRQKSNLFHIGYRYPFGASTVYVAYSKLNDKTATNADTASFGVVYSYALSKRTDLNAQLVRFNNSGNGQAAPGGQGYLGGVTKSAGKDSNIVGFSVRHRF